MPGALSNALEPFENFKRAYNNAEGSFGPFDNSYQGGLPGGYPLATNGLGAPPAPVMHHASTELLDLSSWTGWAILGGGACALYYLLRKKR